MNMIMWWHSCYKVPSCDGAVLSIRGAGVTIKRYNALLLSIRGTGLLHVGGYALFLSIRGHACMWRNLKCIQAPPCDLKTSSCPKTHFLYISFGVANVSLLSTLYWKWSYRQLLYVSCMVHLQLQLLYNLCQSSVFRNRYIFKKAMFSYMHSDSLLVLIYSYPE